MSQIDTHHDAERAPELADFHLPDKPDGPAAAAMLAAGIGIFALGLLTVLSEVSVPLHDWLESAWEMGRGVGPLAGKTTVAVIVWAVSWAILALLWRKKDPNLRTWFTVSLVLGILGALGTFPPIFLSFAAE
jgi:fluoride ion exporter CrcB/FEX